MNPFFYLLVNIASHVLFIASEVIVVALSYNNAAFIIYSEQRTTQIYDYLHKLYFWNVRNSYVWISPLYE